METQRDLIEPGQRDAERKWERDQTLEDRIMQLRQEYPIPEGISGHLELLLFKVIDIFKMDELEKLIIDPKTQQPSW